MAATLSVPGLGSAQQPAEQPAARLLGAEAEAETSSPIRRRRPGTHFILELQGGTTSFKAPGIAGAALFGVGGRPAGTPLRVYFLTELTYTTVARSPRQDDFADRRSYSGIGTGLRIYIPLFFGLRVFGDLLGGGVYFDGDVLTPSNAQIHDSAWDWQLVFGGGLQYRLQRGLSLGARVRWQHSVDPLSDLRTQIGLSDDTVWSLTGGATWHF